VYNALCSNRYVADSSDSSVKTDYSVTTLISPPQITVLKRRYPQANDEDAIDRVWSMFGAIAHTLLEEHGSEESLTEQRFYATIDDRVISGAVDHVKDGIITDYKTTSAYKIKQLNMYAYLAKLSGIHIRNLRVIAIIRDWAERDINTPNYPQAPIVEIPLTLWTFQEQDEYIKGRVAMLKANEEYPDESLYPCTMEDMWQDPPTYAVMKLGAKRATKICNAEDDLHDYLEEQNLLIPHATIPNTMEVVESHYVQKREGSRRRCEKYCAVSSKCVQYQRYLEEYGKDGKDVS
jgi:hypothetical protein